MTVDSPESEQADYSLAIENDGVAVVESTDEGESDVPRPAWKPDIDHLPDAVTREDGVLTFHLAKGDRIVIDYSGLPYGAWMDTRCWVIDKVEPTGFVGLWDPQSQQFGCTDWRKGIERGLVFKVAGVGDWKQPRKSAVSRNSPKRAAVLAHLAKEADKNAPAAEKVKGPGRGRPKGTLNGKTVEMLVERGYDPSTMTREAVNEVMAVIRKEKYEAAKAERRLERESKKEKKGKVG